MPHAEGLRAHKSLPMLIPLNIIVPIKLQSLNRRFFYHTHGQNITRRRYMSLLSTNVFYMFDIPKLPFNENHLDALFIFSLFRQSTSTCFGHICIPSSGGILCIYIRQIGTLLYVLLTVRLSIILVTEQLNVQFLVL